MKIILTGATGFVGGVALEQLLNDNSVTQVTCLLRREIAVQSSKLRLIVLKDFTQYDDALSRELASHDGCVWALGGKTSDLVTEEFEKITVGFTLALAEAVKPRLSKPFRFCYLSGMGADPTERARFPWEKLTRHMKGRTEKRLQDLASGDFHATAFRPAGILPKDVNTLALMLLSPIAIRVDQLTSAMINEIKREPSAPYRVLSNSEIKINSRDSLSS